MNKLYVICIDDQAEVLNALEQDLEDLEDYVMLESCDSGKEALELMDEIDANGDELAIVISDQVMPELSGVDVLSTVNNDSRFPSTKKILLTGLATHQDTIEAINGGGLDYYIEKPWKQDQLIHIIKKGLTEFIMKKGIEYAPYMPVLDQETLYELLKNRT